MAEELGDIVSRHAKNPITWVVAGATGLGAFLLGGGLAGNGLLYGLLAAAGGAIATGAANEFVFKDDVIAPETKSVSAPAVGATKELKLSLGGTQKDIIGLRGKTSADGTRFEITEMGMNAGKTIMWGPARGSLKIKDGQIDLSPITRGNGSAQFAPEVLGINFSVSGAGAPREEGGTSLREEPRGDTQPERPRTNDIRVVTTGEVSSIITNDPIFKDVDGYMSDDKKTLFITRIPVANGERSSSIPPLAVSVEQKGEQYVISEEGRRQLEAAKPDIRARMDLIARSGFVIDGGLYEEPADTLITTSNTTISLRDNLFTGDRRGSVHLTGAFDESGKKYTISNASVAYFTRPPDGGRVVLTTVDIPLEQPIVLDVEVIQTGKKSFTIDATSPENYTKLKEARTEILEKFSAMNLVSNVSVSDQEMYAALERYQNGEGKLSSGNARLPHNPLEQGTGIA